MGPVHTETGTYIIYRDGPTRTIAADVYYDSYEAIDFEQL